MDDSLPSIAPRGRASYSESPRVGASPRTPRKVELPPEAYADWLVNMRRSALDLHRRTDARLYELIEGYREQFGLCLDREPKDIAGSDYALSSVIAVEYEMAARGLPIPVWLRVKTAPPLHGLRDTALHEGPE